MNAESKKSSYVGFLKKLAVVAVCAVFIIIIGLTIFWKYLECYEKSVQTAPIKNFIAQLQSENYEDALAACDDNHEFFSDSEVLKEYAEENFSGKLKNLRYLKSSSEESDGSVLYNVYSDETKILTVSVVKSDEKVGFGLYSYKLKNIEVKYIDDITVCAPADAVVYVNGNVLDRSYAKVKLLDDMFMGISEDECPSMLIYSIGGCVSYPEIAVVVDTKTVLEAKDTSDRFNLTYLIPCNKEEKNSLEEFSLTVGKAYADFITGDMPKETLLSYIYSKSDFYNDMKEYDNSWYGSHSGVKYENIEISDINIYGEGFASVNIKMLQTMKRGGKDMSFDLDYTISYIYTGNDWKVVNIITK